MSWQKRKAAGKIGWSLELLNELSVSIQWQLQMIYYTVTTHPCAQRACLLTKQVKVHLSICTHLIFPVVDQQGQEDYSIITMLPSTGHIWQNLRRGERENRDDQRGKNEGFKITWKSQKYSTYGLQLITYLQNGFKDAVDHHIFQDGVLTNIVCHL